MRAIVSATALVFTLVLSLLLVPQRAQAQAWLDNPFDAATMSREDIATLQAALAFSQDYYGYLTGAWDQQSQDAFTAYVSRVYKRNTPTYRDLNDLIMSLEDERVAHNWQLYYDETSNTSYLHPFGLLEQLESKSDTELEFLSEDEEFSMIVRYEDEAGMKSSHDWFMQKVKAGTNPYTYSDANLALTWTTIENDFQAYVRSDKYKDGWVTISIVVTKKYYGHVNLLAASATVGGSPAALIWTEGGVIDQVINGATTAAAPPPASDDPKDQVRRPLPPGVAEAPPPAAAPEPPNAPVEVVVPGPTPGEKPAGPVLGTPAPGSVPVSDTPAKPPLGTPAPGGTEVAEGPAPVRAPGTDEPPAATTEPPPTEVAEAPKPKVSGTLKSSGSGFYIAPTTLVTAAHVIEGCSAVALADGTPLEIMAADATLDVAVLGGATDAGVWLKLSALEVAKLGEAVTALGYPYYTSLDQGLTVTTGNVAALRGTDGEQNRLMITTPVQPGNSGGPLLNKKGAVIGVVVSRIDDLAVLEETGSLPQNMNFAVPSGPLLTFLAQNRITRPQGNGTSGEISSAVPEGVANAVVPLHCYQ